MIHMAHDIKAATKENMSSRLFIRRIFIIQRLC